MSGPGNLPWDSVLVFGATATATATPVDALDEAFELVAQLPFEPLTLVEELATCEADELLLRVKDLIHLKNNNSSGSRRGGLPQITTSIPSDMLVLRTITL